MGNTVSGCTPVIRRADPGKELLRCAEAGETGALSLILSDDARYLVHSSVFGGNTAWHKAAKAGRVEVLDAMEALITRQFQPCKDLSREESELRAIVLRMGASPEIILRRLINRVNLKGVTPLMLAAMGGHTGAVAWLIKRGADVWRHDRIRRQTALHGAVEFGATDAIRLLLAHAGTAVHPHNGKTLLEQGNHAGLTALHYATYCDQYEVLQQLVAYDVDITAQAEYPDLDWGSVNAGDTAMHIAANRGNIESIQALLRAFNERSGALVPSDPSVPRRLRDPRAMRNDYGRLPYHLAMRKGFPWLAEMLDPSVPVRYLLVGEQLDTGTVLGPPRLATIAASVLHKSLVADLQAIKAEAAAQEAVHQLACGSKAAAPEDGAAGVAGMWLLGVEQQDEPAAAAAAAGDAGQRSGRRWAFTSHRRSGSGGAGSRTPSHRRSGSGGAGALQQLAEGVGRLSRRQAGFVAAAASSSRASSRRSSSRNEGGGAMAAGPLSPRLLRSVMRGTPPGAAGDADCLECAVLDEQCCEPGLGQEGIGASCPPSPAAAAAAAGGAGSSSSWVHDMAEVVVSGALAASLSPHRRVKQAAAAGANWLCSSSSGQHAQQIEADDCDDSDSDVAERLPLQQCSSRPFSPCSSSVSCYSPGLDASGCWQEEAGEPCGAVSEQLCSNAGGDCGGKVSPLPELASDSQGAGLLAAALVQHRATPSGGRCSEDSSATDGSTCGVCLDAEPTARILPCDHSMCADCALDMCQRFSMSTAVCPFCRCAIRGFAPASSARRGAAAAAGGGITAARVAAPLAAALGR